MLFQKVQNSQNYSENFNNKDNSSIHSPKILIDDSASITENQQLLLSRFKFDSDYKRLLYPYYSDTSNATNDKQLNVPNFSTLKSIKISKNKLLFIKNNDFQDSIAVYDSTEETYKTIFTWYGDKQQKSQCQMQVNLGYKRSRDCRNLIKVFSLHRSTSIENDHSYSTFYMHLCGTNYLSPICSLFKLNVDLENYQISLLSSTSNRNKLSLPNKLANHDQFGSFQSNLLIAYSERNLNNHIIPAKIVKLGKNINLNNNNDNNNNKIYPEISTPNTYLSKNYQMSLPPGKKVKFLAVVPVIDKFLIFYNELNFEQELTTRVAQLCAKEIQVSGSNLIGSKQNTDSISSFIKARLICNQNNRAAKYVYYDNINKSLYAIFESSNSIYVCNYEVSMLSDYFRNVTVHNSNSNLVNFCNFTDVSSEEEIIGKKSGVNTDTDSSKIRKISTLLVKSDLKDSSSSSSTMNPISDKLLIDQKIQGTLIFRKERLENQKISSFTALKTKDQFSREFYKIFLKYDDDDLDHFVVSSQSKEYFSQQNFELSKLEESKLVHFMENGQLVMTSRLDLKSGLSKAVIDNFRVNCSFAPTLDCCSSLKEPSCYWDYQSQTCSWGLKVANTNKNFGNFRPETLNTSYIPSVEQIFKYDLPTSVYRCQNNGNLPSQDDFIVNSLNSTINHSDLKIAKFWNRVKKYLKTSNGQIIFYSSLALLILTILSCSIRCWLRSNKNREIRKDAAALHSDANALHSEVYKLVNQLSNNTNNNVHQGQNLVNQNELVLGNQLDFQQTMGKNKYSVDAEVRELEKLYALDENKNTVPPNKSDKNRDSTAIDVTDNFVFATESPRLMQTVLPPSGRNTTNLKRPIKLNLNQTLNQSFYQTSALNSNANNTITGPNVNLNNSNYYQLILGSDQGPLLTNSNSTASKLRYSNTLPNNTTPNNNNDQGFNNFNIFYQKPNSNGNENPLSNQDLNFTNNTFNFNNTMNTINTSINQTPEFTLLLNSTGTHVQTPLEVQLDRLAGTLERTQKRLKKNSSSNSKSNSLSRSLLKKSRSKSDRNQRSETLDFGTTASSSMVPLKLDTQNSVPAQFHYNPMPSTMSHYNLNINSESNPGSFNNLHQNNQYQTNFLPNSKSVQPTSTNNQKYDRLIETPRHFKSFGFSASDDSPMISPAETPRENFNNLASFSGGQVLINTSISGGENSTIPVISPTCLGAAPNTKSKNLNLDAEMSEIRSTGESSLELSPLNFPKNYQPLDFSVVSSKKLDQSKNELSENETPRSHYSGKLSDRKNVPRMGKQFGQKWKRNNN